jgi:DNA-binding MarR family transcriptional regulator
MARSPVGYGAAVDRVVALQTIDAALTRIGRVANSRRAATRRAQRAGVNLSTTAVAALAVTYRHGPARLGTLAEHLDLEPSRASKEMRRLIDAGLVTQAPDPDDRRASLLSVTKEGAAAFRRYRKAADQMLAEALADWSDTEMSRVAIHLDRLAAKLTTSEVRAR